MGKEITSSSSGFPRIAATAVCETIQYIGIRRVEKSQIGGLGDLCAMRAKCAPNVRHVKVRCKSDLNLCETQMSGF